MSKIKGRKRSCDVLNEIDSKAAYNKALEHEVKSVVYVDEKLEAFIKV